MNTNDFDVIVIGSAHVNALGVIRALGENGIKSIVLLTGRKNGYIKKSKYVKEVYYAALDDNDIMDVLINKINTGNKRCYLIPTGDYVAATIDKNISLLKDKYIVPSIGGVDNSIIQYMDKNEQYILSKKYNFKMAKTKLIDLTKKNIKNDIYPCILKPSISAIGLKADIRICKNGEEFDRAINEFKNKNYSNVLLQELLDYDYEVDVPGYCDGKVANINGIIKKINVFPAKRGSACFMKVEKPNLPILEQIKQFFIDINYNGIFDVDLFVKGQEIYLNEINFRNGAISYAMTGNKNYIVLDWILANEGITRESKILEKEYYYMVEDYNFRLVLSRDISLLRFIKEFIKTKKYAYISFNDPKPLLYKFIYALRKGD